MNNCYFGLRGGGVGAEGVECPGDDDNHHHSLLHRQMLDGDQEERDRSLPQVEVYHDQLSHVNQPMLEEEELPDMSFSSDSVPIEKSVNKRQLQNEKGHERTATASEEVMRHSSSGISRGSASVARSASSGTASRTKFLSRSHNSLLPPAPPDYSKVESKVKKYIDAMKELGRQRRQAQPPSPERLQSDSISPSTATGPSPEVQEDEKTIELRLLLAEREAKVFALQENHDRLLLDNARLQNMLDDMRAKLRMQQLKNQQKVPVRRTNSPSDLKGDPLAASTAHGSNGQRDHPSTSRLELMMLPTAVASAGGNNRPGDNNTSSSFSNYSSSIESASDSAASNGECNSIVHRDYRREHAIHLAASTATTLTNEQLNYQQHRHMILDNRKPLKTLEKTRFMQQLKEATLAALFVRDQTRTLINRMNRLPS